MLHIPITQVIVVPLTKNVIFAIILAIICAASGFVGGLFYGQSRTKTLVSQLEARASALELQVQQLQQQLQQIQQQKQKKIKAAFIYVGPIGDYGWSYAHEMARRIVTEKFKDWLETTYVEDVDATECPQVIDKLVSEGYTVIFTTSFDFMDPTYEAAKKYPNIIFFHCSGYRRYKNLGTYFADLYQIYYLNGLMAGALTKTGHVGYVGANPIPEVIRHINAFALGVKEVNPKAKVYVLWVHEWYAPSKARELAETLISKYNCDVLAFTEDSPAVVQTCQEYYEKGKPVYVFSHYSPMLTYGKDVCVSGQLVHWEAIYEDILLKIRQGIYNTTNLEHVDYWWLLKEGAVELGCDYGVPINPKFVPILKKIKVNETVVLPNGTIVKNPSVYDLVFIRLEQMKQDNPTFDPFTGPIYDQQGNLRVPPRNRLGHDALWNMDWFVDNVVGEISEGGG